MFNTGNTNRRAPRPPRAAMPGLPPANPGSGFALRLSPLFLLAAALAALAVVFMYDARSVSAQAVGQEVRPAVQVPGPVTGLTLSSTATSVTVRWQAPASGDEPTRYIAHLRPEGGEGGSGRTKTPKAKKTSVTFNNLEPGATYKVWVRARNAGGKGERVHAVITLPQTDALPNSIERPVEVIRCEQFFSTAYCDSFK